MNFIQTTLQALEVGRGRIVIRIAPLVTALLIVGGAYDMIIYRGLSDAQSMDNAQVARQIFRHQGFTTEFLRPQAVAQLRDYAVSQSMVNGKSRDLFPPDRFPPGTPRVLPDTYNAPGYPYLLAAWFAFTRPEFTEPWLSISTSRIYSPDRWIPLLNQGFMLLTAVLVFALGRRLFDDRVAWISMLAFVGTDLVWHFTVTALSTSFLMFLVTATLMCALEVFCVSEACFQNEDRSFGPAWIWGLAVALLLSAACLTRLHLVVLLIPLLVSFAAMPRSSFLLFAAVAFIVLGTLMPWFIHVNNISGNPLGSNVSLFLYGESGYAGNQIYCTTSIPSYQPLFRDAIKKELTGFRWHFEHAWNLLGANPMILLFGASILHPFRRRRTRFFHWLLFSCALSLVLANNLGSATPEDVGPWNILALLLPCMLVIGSAYFFVLLDRINTQIMLLNSMIVTAVMALTLVPLVLTLTNPSPYYYAFPPYMPPLIKEYGQLAAPDEWITSDMPWATAWYADRASLWLPDSIVDFQNFYDNISPTGLILLTPVSNDEPLSTFTTGEYKDWFSLVTGASAPSNFPLSQHTATASGGPDYSLWSDRPRWSER